MPIHFRQVNNSLVVLGDTYHFREPIKALGGRFQGVDKTWVIPVSDSARSELLQLCIRSGGGELPTISSPSNGSMGSVSARVPDGTGRLDRSTESAVINDDDHVPKTAEQRSVRESKVQGDGITISQLMTQATTAVSSAFPEPVWVIGEIQNVVQKPSGIFLNLAEAKDPNSPMGTITVKALIWGSAVRMLTSQHGKDRLRDILQDGLRVRVKAQVSVYRDRGQLSLTILEIDPEFTKGSLALAREELMRELRSKGLDQANKQLTLSAWPLTIGLISADDSRAKSDFLDQVAAVGFPGKVFYKATPMQGDAVPEKVATAIKIIVKAKCDLIVITRGGGSAADLRWFDSREIAYAIAECGVPVLAAIGHHDDTCVAEMIAFAREKTPTAAADFVGAIFRETGERLRQLAHRLASILDYRLQSVLERQRSALERLSSRAIQSIMQRNGQLTQLGHGITRAADQKRQGFELHLGRLSEALIKADPKPWLALGWTQFVRGKDRIHSGAQLSVGDKITAVMNDSTIALTVDAVTPHPKLPSQSKKSSPKEHSHHG